MSACILWPKGVTSAGYGSHWHEGKRKQAHRVAWEQEHGPIPEGLHVLHKCDVKRCVNVEHLFLGTHVDNMKDMAVKGRAWSPNILKTHCPKGHEYSEENTYRDSKGWRKCRTCVLKRVKARHATLMAASSSRD